MPLSGGSYELFANDPQKELVDAGAVSNAGMQPTKCLIGAKRTKLPFSHRS